VEHQPQQQQQQQQQPTRAGLVAPMMSAPEPSGSAPPTAGQTISTPQGDFVLMPINQPWQQQGTSRGRQRPAESRRERQRPSGYQRGAGRHYRSAGHGYPNNGPYSPYF